MKQASPHLVRSQASPLLNAQQHVRLNAYFPWLSDSACFVQVPRELLFQLGYLPGLHLAFCAAKAAGLPNGEKWQSAHW